MVRLITHNILTCAVKSCVESGKNFPLNFKNVKSIEIHEQDFNKDFILSFYQKLDFDIFLNTLNDVSVFGLLCTRMTFLYISLAR